MFKTSKTNTLHRLNVITSHAPSLKELDFDMFHKAKIEGVGAF